jgi:ATP-dependent protease ClpP protease subunit
MNNFLRKPIVITLAGAILSCAYTAICQADIGTKGCDATMKMCWYKISGTITAQDAQAAAKIPAHVPPGNQLFVLLESPGGDVDAAIAIGRILRNRGAIAQIMPNRVCASACVLLLAGATNRVIPTTARVGIHRLYSASTSPKDYSALQLEYRQIESKVKTYLREMNVPEALYDAMMQFQSENIYFLTISELQSYHLSNMDYVAEDLANSRAATRYGLSKPEYLRRSAQATKQCDHYLDQFNHSLKDDLLIRYTECRESIFRDRK